MATLETAQQSTISGEDWQGHQLPAGAPPNVDLKTVREKGLSTGVRVKGTL